MTVDDVQVIYKIPSRSFQYLIRALHFTAAVQAMMLCSTSVAVAALLAVIPCVVFSAEIPNLQPGDDAPSFVLQAIDVKVGTNDVLLKYGTGNDSNIHGPILFLAHTNRSGFLERLLSDPDSFKELLENSPDNTNYVFLFYATSSSTVRAVAQEYAQRFDSALNTYYSKR